LEPEPVRSVQRVISRGVVLAREARPGKKWKVESARERERERERERKNSPKRGDLHIRVLERVWDASHMILLPR
jgi:hypothetical protein